MDLLMGLDAPQPQQVSAAPPSQQPVDPFAAMAGLSIDAGEQQPVMQQQQQQAPVATDEQLLLSAINAQGAGRGGGMAMRAAATGAGNAMRPSAQTGPKDPFADLLG